MLVIVSDLHFTDGTTSNWKDGEDLFNVRPKAFELFVTKISDILSRREKSPRKVTFLYNGDIFDLLRTTAWFDVKDRPWSVPLDKKKVYARCHTILEEILRKNEESISWLSGDHPHFQEAWRVDAEIERIYVPGNHDRIINLYEPCRKQVYRKLLGKRERRRFANFYMDQDFHQTLVMHGHESDPFNCEYDKMGNPDYNAVPIGDPLTTELFARIAYEAGKLPIPEEAKARFKDIDNVRPTLATVRYVQDIINDFSIGDKVKDVLGKVVGDFEDLEFYRQWKRRHDRFNLGFDEADKLEWALRAVRLLGPSVPAGLLEKLAALVRDDSCEKLAKRRVEDVRGGNLRYCVMGHTHEPLHVPLCVDERLNMERHYLNCGTFRTTFSQTYDKQEFLRFQRMSFVIVYGPGEYRPDEERPLYEMWSGLRMHH
ncbi:MAG: metallophosphoesterase [Deltaproteobacteria bacterium]|nr:metallophosphoesterase [Deltaproteobacteria bacterium]MBW2015999.1 metallophosphoesterase [Deltaproteobacteria bacterium]MBW2128935.1 metallophosphoesterase [Deltaproteobacteria bacterium]MBW2303437.1 metallophosphoesterase [Deltaproteobacteria bacterium]